MQRTILSILVQWTTIQIEMFRYMLVLEEYSNLAARLASKSIMHNFFNYGPHSGILVLRDQTKPVALRFPRNEQPWKGDIIMKNE